MARELRGIVRGGVIVLEGGERLPEGTKVRIVVEEEAPRKRIKWLERLLELTEKAKLREGEKPCSDMSERTDEYLTGKVFGHSVGRAEGGKR